MVSLRSCRRFALTSAALLVVVAVVVAAGVIPSVKVDTYSAATLQRAVPAFWVNVGLNILLAFVVLLAAIALTEAASAFGNGETHDRVW